MMDERRLVAQRVMRALRHESARKPLLGDQIVVCVGTDTVAYASGRVRAVGGEATVVVPRGDYLVPLNWRVGRPVAALELCAEQRVHPDSEISMVIELMATSDIREIAIRIEAGEVAVTEGEPLTVPA